MIFLSNSQGTIVASSPGTLHQGGINANEIILLAPFTSTATVQASFRLPGGLLTYPRLLEVGETEGTQEEYPYTLALGEAFAGTLPDGFNLWKMTMDKALTERAGTLGISFIITTPEGRITTDEATTNIIKGGAYISPSVSEDDYSEIGKILSSMQTALLNAETAQENAVKAQENAVKAASTAQGSEQNATAIWNNMNAYVERMNTHDRRISEAQKDITSLDDRVKDLEALNLDYLEVEGDSDTGIVQVPSGFWVGSKAYVNSLGGKTYRLGYLPDNMITYNEQFGQPVDLGEDVIATIENGNLKTLSAGCLYVIKPGITVNTTKSVEIVTYINFSTPATFRIKQSPTADIETFSNYKEYVTHNNGQPIILFMESETTITSIRFKDWVGESGRAFIVEPIMYASYGLPKSEEDYNNMSAEAQAYCIPYAGGDNYCCFYDWGLSDKDYKPAVFTLSDTKITGISSHGTNLFDESQIKAVDGDKDGEDWGEPVDDDEGRYLLSNRAFEGVGGNKWLGFSMELTPGKYTISADCYVPSNAPNLKVVLGLRTYEPGGSTTMNAELSNKNIWERVSVAIPIKTKGTYFLTAQGRGAGGDSTKYKMLGVRFKNICVSRYGSTDYVPFRGVTGVIDRIDVPPEITYLDGYGVSCGYYERLVSPYDMLSSCNEVDVENGTYTNKIGEYVFTGKEDMTVRPYNYGYGIWVYFITVPLLLIRAEGITIDCDKYLPISNSYLLEEDGDHPGCINVRENNVVTIATYTSDINEFRKELKGTVLRYVLESPLKPVKIELDGLIEVEPGGYIEVETDTGRGAPIGVTFVVSKE